MQVSESVPVALQGISSTWLVQAIKNNKANAMNANNTFLIFPPQKNIRHGPALDLGVQEPPLILAVYYLQ